MAVFLRYQGSVDKLKKKDGVIFLFFYFFIYVFFCSEDISDISTVINAPTRELVPGETKGSFV